MTTIMGESWSGDDPRGAVKFWAFIMLLSFALGSGVVGLGWAQGMFGVHNEWDDMDCQTPEGNHDERSPACHEYCHDAPVWWEFGHRQECWWDDNATGAPQ